MTAWGGSILDADGGSIFNADLQKRMKTPVVEKHRNAGERRFMETGTLCELIIVALYIIKIFLH